MTAVDRDEAPLDALDSGDLSRSERAGVQRWQVPDLGTPGRCVGVVVGLPKNASEATGLREGKDAARARIGIVTVGEVRLRAAGLEDERQTSVDRPSRQTYVGGQAAGVHRRLPLHAGERVALRFGLDDAHNSLVDIQQVVRTAVARFHHGLAAGDTRAGEEVEVLLVLYRPAGGLQLRVDEDTSSRFGGETVLGAAGHESASSVAW
nr:hypothetical protein [Tersicoccus solisilvae]